MESTKRTSCRCCGSSDLVELMSLGDQLVSDFPRSCTRCFGGPCDPNCPERWQPVSIPIVLDLCRSCTLVQARHTPPPDLLYKRHYHYRSSITQTMRDALADVAEACQRAVELKPGDVVLDIGSNDGTLLRCFPKELTRVGCEPAENLNTFANYETCGLQVVRDFWNEVAWEYVRDKTTFITGNKTGNPKIVCAIGMFYDCDDPNQFVADVAKVLHPEGVFVAQLMCLRQMIKANDVGNLAHEHLEFYTLRSLTKLFEKHGLEIYDVEENDVNGGSYRLFARHDKRGALRPQIVHKALHAEKRAGLWDAEAIRETVTLWYLNQEELRERLMQFVRHQVVNLKRKLWIYGASTKGNALLQWWGIGPELAVAAADRDPLKVGRFTVNGIPIVSEEEFRKADPDFALVLPYAFRAEFVERESEWLQGGGQFIVPLPSPKVVRIRMRSACPGPSSFGGIEEVAL